MFCIALWLVRSQTTVEDESYMRAMIPHHSIAILTSSRAEIDDGGCVRSPTPSSTLKSVRSRR